MKSQGQVLDRKKVDRLSQASDWLLRLQEPTRTEEEYSEWLLWCDADAENFAAFETVQRRWQALDALKSADFTTEADANWKDVPDLPLTPAQKAALLEHETQELRAVGHYAPPRARDLRVPLALAASVLGVAAALLFLERDPDVPESAQQQVAAAHINRAATLPDGSKMILGAQSRVNMDFNGEKRQLHLSAGEAYFKVKHDKQRPFIVQAGEVSVTAIGTAFDVRRDRDKVIVTVEEGIVEIASSSSLPSGQGKDGPQTWRAEAGHQLTYSTRKRTASLARINPAAVLSWRDGELAYLYEPLGSVVEDLNRYADRKLVIADQEVANILFTGTAFAASLEGWLAGIERAYPVDATESDSGEIILSSRR